MPQSHSILTIDIGSTNCKVSLFHPDGKLACSAIESYPTFSRLPGQAEQKPLDWWSAVIGCLRRIRLENGWDSDSIAAISVTGQMHGILPIDADGNVLFPCLTLHDQRATQNAGQIIQQFGLSGIYQISGERFSPSSPLAKIAWLAEHEPEIHKQTRYYLSCKDYIKYLLSGTFSTDPIEAAGTLLYDIRSEEWSPSLLAACSILEYQLPPILPPADFSGQLTSAAASLLGLKAGLPVMVGAGDDIECLGMGVAQKGQSLEHFGTTGSIATCVGECCFDPEFSIEVYPHPEPGLWLLGGSVNNAGKALSWASQLLYGEERISVSRILDGLGAEDCQKPLIFLPHLTGERCPVWNPDLRGSWLGLSIQHDRNELFRAVAQGTLFSLRSVIERIEQLAGPVTGVTVSDSIENGASWLALRANIYRKKLQLVDCIDPTALGAMMVAGVGIGLFSSYHQAVQALVSLKGQIEPDESLAELYDRRYSWYQQALEINSPFFERLSAAQAEETGG